MNAVRFSPIMGMLLLLLVGVAVALSFSANPPRTNLGQVPTSVATILPTIPVTIPVPTVVTATHEVFPTIGTEERQTREAVHGPILPYSTPQAEALMREAEMYQSLYTRPGNTIAHGTNQTPSGRYRVKTYRLDELTLPGPTTFTRRVVGSDITVERAWRLIVTGEHFGVGANNWQLFVNGTPLATGTVRLSNPQDPNSIEEKLMFILFDRSALTEGATIAVSYGIAVPTELPERIHFAP